MFIRSAALALSAILLTAAARPAAKPTPAAAGLDTILAQLDAASARFHSAQANLQYDNYTKVVHDHDISGGSLFIERDGARLTMGAVYYKPGGKGTPIRILNYDGTLFQSYTPGTNQDDVFKAGANQAKYESFLTLGFGGSGRDLARAWTITGLGPEPVNGTPTEKLDLVSKDPSVRNLFPHITIWVDPARGVSLKQVFYADNGDSRTAVYSDIRLNGKPDRKPYEIPRSAQKIQH